MPSRRGAIALTDQEQEAFLKDSWTLQVASNGHKGFPHLVAMWYVIIDGKIHFTTFGKSQKIMNLRRDPKITCMLEAGKGYSELRGLVIEGNADVDYESSSDRYLVLWEHWISATSVLIRGQLLTGTGQLSGQLLLLTLTNISSSPHVAALRTTDGRPYRTVALPWPRPIRPASPRPGRP